MLMTRQKIENLKSSFNPYRHTVKFFGPPDSLAFILLFLTCSGIQHLVPFIIWFKRTPSFRVIHLKSQFDIYFVREWITLPEFLKYRCKYLMLFYCEITVNCSRHPNEFLSTSNLSLASYSHLLQHFVGRFSRKNR